MIFLEHKMLHDETGEVPDRSYATPFGQARIVREGRHAVLSGDSNGTTRPSIAVGSTWQSRSSPFSQANASPGTIADRPTLEREVDAWNKHRNTHNAKADWRFTTDAARLRLTHLYPILWMIQATRGLHAQPKRFI